MSVGVGAFTLRLLLNMKRGTSPLNSQLNNMPFCFYDKTFYKNLFCPKVKLITFTRRAVWGKVVTFNNRIPRPFNYVEQNGYLKILIECAWGKGKRGRRVNYSPMTFDY